VHLGTHFEVLVPEHFGNPKQLGATVSGKTIRQSFVVVVKEDEHKSLQPEEEALVPSHRIGIVVQFVLSDPGLVTGILVGVVVGCVLVGVVVGCVLVGVVVGCVLVGVVV